MPPPSAAQLLKQQEPAAPKVCIRDGLCVRVADWCKPRFVSKKEREQHKADAQRAEQAAEQERLRRIQQERAQWEKQRDAPAPPDGDSAHGKRARSATPADDGSPADVDREQLEIRQRYLGVREARAEAPRKTRRAADGNRRFNFEWDEGEDTSDQRSLVWTEGERMAATLGGRGGLEGSERRAGNGGARSTLKSTLDEKHWSEKRLEEMKERDWRIFREDYEISAKGGHLAPPLRTWRESAIPPAIIETIESIGYKDPSPIQRQAIPIGLQNRDLIGIAETGSGKTASYVIPLLAYVMALPRMSDINRDLGPYALILAPTRELAQQIEGEARRFAAPLGFNVVSLVGGRDMTEQAFNMRDGAEVVIATPGRLVDCLERHVLVLSQCTYLVLDEADRMVEQGFEEALNFILDSLPASNLKPESAAAEEPERALQQGGEPYRVTMLYSATMPPSVERIARTYLRRPATVTIGNVNQAVGTVDQQVEFVSSEERRKQRLLSVLDSGFAPPMIVFVNQIKTADVVGRDIRRAGWNVAILHSGLSQPQREAAIASVRDGRNDVLCCTDVGARGIDVPDVSLVVNYQFPTNFPSYIHRIGRTGRAGKTGTAISFVDEYDQDHFYELRQELAKSPVSKVPQELARHPAAQRRAAQDA